MRITSLKRLTPEEASLTLLKFLSRGTSVEKLKQASVLVFGHNDPRVADHAAQIWHEGKARNIIVSGGVGPRTSLEIVEKYGNEARFYAKRLREAGVPDSDIILEEKSTNTLENVQMSFALALKEKVSLNRVIGVAMPPLLCRTRTTMSKWMPSESIVQMSSFTPEDPKEFLSEAWTRRMLTEIDNMDKYAQAGHIKPVEISGPTILAYRRLREVYPAPTPT